MPEGITEYFGSAPDPVKLGPVENLPDAITSATLQVHPSDERYSNFYSRLSAVIGKLCSPRTDQSTLSSEEKSIQELFRSYKSFFSDLIEEGEYNRSIPFSSGKEKDELSFDAAVLNQRLARDILALNKGACNPEYVQSATTLRKVLEAFQHEGMSIGQDGLGFLNGAQAQAAVMNTLGDHGYAVFMPDPDNRDEVALWDVMAGVDMAAVHENPSGDYTMYLIDIQGRIAQQTPEVFNNADNYPGSMGKMQKAQAKVIKTLHAAMVEKKQEEMQALGVEWTKEEQHAWEQRLTESNVVWETIVVSTHPENLSDVGTFRSKKMEHELIERVSTVGNKV